MRKNVVLDTNTIISALLFPNSIPRQAFDKAIDNFQVVCSDKCFEEILDVLTRPKFNKYLSENERFYFIEGFKKKIIFIQPTETITDCRDPKDDKFLELAIAADALFIVTGDNDLLVLNPYRGIEIVKSSDFVVISLV
jgi:uncharacterized protein